MADTHGCVLQPALGFFAGRLGAQSAESSGRRPFPLGTPHADQKGKQIETEQTTTMINDTNQRTGRPAAGMKRQRMGNADMEDNSLHEAFLDELADVYNAEQQLTKALPRMAKAAQSADLREAFESHLEETQKQATRLEQAAESLGESLKRKKCKAMEGLIEEAKEMMDEFKGEPALDAVLIAAAQKVEHYEIASYGTLCAWAQQMGHDEAFELLQASLDEEEAADQKLTNIAETSANQKAETESTS